MVPPVFPFLSTPGESLCFLIFLLGTLDRFCLPFPVFDCFEEALKQLEYINPWGNFHIELSPTLIFFSFFPLSYVVIMPSYP